MNHADFPRNSIIFSFVTGSTQHGQRWPQGNVLPRKEGGTQLSEGEKHLI